MDVKFCMTCGSPLVLRDVDGTMRMACSDLECKFVHWGNYSIGVGALVVKDEKVLLVRRAQEPGRGYWTNPGGYVEQTELIHETIRREVMEEAGIDAVVTTVVAFRDQPRMIHNVYIAFAMDYVGGEPVPDGIEVDAAGFYSLEEMASMNVAGFTKWLVHIALQRKSDGLTFDDNPIVPLDGYGLFRAE
ncbi:NUDIX domain-containing protein [Paenibacillus mendelii]|uniref:NUDIX domain-containing protein n=1 Tax=Paenibacillus mendelii TaxID=206163 RepID=A0ABV6J5M5_9BACL|nr:NUDIX domain-containing protein [Paenibacillus mendelii]MCQ6560104.1 NUDIX domain-containing protein [Paenibacillus mendelii]